MRTNGVSLTLSVLAAAGLCMLGARLAAGAQDDADSKKGAVHAPPATNYAPEQPGDIDIRKSGSDDSKKLNTRDQQKLHTELDGLLKQRSDLDRRITDLRDRLGDRNQGRRRIEIQSGDGKPQVFEFDGDGNLPPEAKKQLEEASKRLQDAFKNMPMPDFPRQFNFDNLPDGRNFQFRFNGKDWDGGQFKPDGKGSQNFRQWREANPEFEKQMKEFQQRMQQWQRDFTDQMRRRSHDEDEDAPSKPNKERKSDTSAPKKLKTLDA